MHWRLDIAPSAMSGNLPCDSSFQQPLLNGLRKMIFLDASVVINPLQFGTGLKIKSIEALAMKRPLVTTPNGATGLEEWADRAFLCARTHDEFAEAIIQIFKSNELRSKLKKETEMFNLIYNQNAIEPLIKEIDIFLDNRHRSTKT